jgi:hypothetical protein
MRHFLFALRFGLRLGAVRRGGRVLQPLHRVLRLIVGFRYRCVVFTFSVAYCTGVGDRVSIAAWFPAPVEAGVGVLRADHFGIIRASPRPLQSCSFAPHFEQNFGIANGN